MTHRLLPPILLALFLIFSACVTRHPTPPSAPPCSQAWFLHIEQHYAPSADAEGHGPDLGDPSWFNIIEKQLHLPNSSGATQGQRCQQLDGALRQHVFLIHLWLGVWVW